MAIVELRPPRNRTTTGARERVEIIEVSDDDELTPPPLPVVTPPLPVAVPKNLAKIEVGPVVIEQRESGDLVIYTQRMQEVASRVGNCDVRVKQMVPSEANRLVVQDEDVDDLLVALDRALENRAHKLTK